MIREAIEDLDRVFHHEADFQHALAWNLHNQHPDARIRLERRFRELDFPGTIDEAYIDIWIETDNITVPVELKYKPNRFSGDWGKESFALRRHSAQDISRFDFVDDIARIETVANGSDCEYGVVILLTNDHLYWQPPTREDVVDYEFRLHEGKVLRDTLTWSEDVGAGTVGQKRDRPIELEGKYELHWRNYRYEIPAESEGNTDFRFLFVKVPQ